MVPSITHHKQIENVPSPVYIIDCTSEKWYPKASPKFSLDFYLWSCFTSEFSKNVNWNHCFSLNIRAKCENLSLSYWVSLKVKWNPRTLHLHQMFTTCDSASISTIKTKCICQFPKRGISNRNWVSLHFPTRNRRKKPHKPLKSWISLLHALSRKRQRISYNI